MGIKITTNDGKVVRLRADGSTSAETGAAIARQEQQANEASALPVAKVVDIPLQAPAGSTNQSASGASSAQPAATVPPSATLSINFDEIEKNWQKAIKTGDAEKDADLLKKIMEMIKAFFSKLLSLRQPGFAGAASPGAPAPAPAPATGTATASTPSGSPSLVAALAKHINQLAATVTPPTDLSQISSKETIKTLFKLKANAASSDLAHALGLSALVVQNIRAKWAANAEKHCLGAEIGNDHLQALPTMTAGELARIDPSGELHAFAGQLPKVTDHLRKKTENLVILMQVFAESQAVGYAELESALKAKNLSFRRLITIAQETKSHAAVDGLVGIAKRIQEKEPHLFENSDLASMLKGMVPPAAEKKDDKVPNTTQEKPTADLAQATVQVKNVAPAATYQDQDTEESHDSPSHAMPS